MSLQFQTTVDACGNLTTADGMVIDRASGAVFETGTPDGPVGAIGGPAPSLSDAQEVPRVQGATFLGGSGRNVHVTGIAPFAGIYRPGRPGFFKLGGMVIEVSGSSAATLSDGTNVVAELTTGGDAPGGSYVATTYGRDTYNSGTAFTLTAAKETGWPGAPSDLEIEISAGTAKGGIYTSTDGINYESADDPDWTLVLNSDGSVDFSYLGTVIARRETGDDADPCGVCEATEDGLVYNPEPPEAYDGPATETNPFGTLLLSFGWAGTPDLDIGVTFLGETVGWGQSGVSDYMTWSGDNITTGGPETVEIDLAAAWEAGEIDTFADVMALADWFPEAGGSGPATLTVTYNGGSPVTHTIHPSSATPAITEALALRITADGSIVPTGATWTATVRAIRQVPVAGIVYISITETSGAVSAADGPFFAASLPAPSGGTLYFPITTSDGAGDVKQIHTGPLVWAAGSGGGGVAFTEIDEADYVALGTPPDIYYDVILE